MIKPPKYAQTTSQVANNSDNYFSTIDVEYYNTKYKSDILVNDNTLKNLKWR